MRKCLGGRGDSSSLDLEFVKGPGLVAPGLFCSGSWLMDWNSRDMDEHGHGTDDCTDCSVQRQRSLPNEPDFSCPPAAGAAITLRPERLSQKKRSPGLVGRDEPYFTRSAPCLPPCRARVR